MPNREIIRILKKKYAFQSLSADDVPSSMIEVSQHNLSLVGLLVHRDQHDLGVVHDLVADGRLVDVLITKANLQQNDFKSFFYKKKLRHLFFGVKVSKVYLLKL